MAISIHNHPLSSDIIEKSLAISALDQVISLSIDCTPSLPLTPLTIIHHYNPKDLQMKKMDGFCVKDKDI